MSTGLKDATPDLASREKPCPVATDPRVALPVGTPLTGGPSSSVPLAATVAIPPPVVPPVMPLPTPVPSGGRL